VRALLDRATPDVIEPLYKDLGTAEGRLQDDIADALARLTGVNFGVNPTQWESWWAQKKSTMKTLQPLTAEQLVELKTKEKEQITQSTPLYFGLRIRSDSIAFLVDCSESMNEEYKPAGAAPEPAVAKGKTTVAKKAEPEPGAKRGTTSTAKARKKRPGWKSRLDVAKKELTEAISRLPEGQVLNVIRFNSLLSDFCATVFPETQQTKTPPGLNPDVRTKVIDYVKASKGRGAHERARSRPRGFQVPAGRHDLPPVGWSPHGGRDGPRRAAARAGSDESAAQSENQRHQLPSEARGASAAAGHRGSDDGRVRGEIGRAESGAGFRD
jgi:hypothetical protein